MEGLIEPPPEPEPEEPETPVDDSPIDLDSLGGAPPGEGDDSGDADDGQGVE